MRECKTKAFSLLRRWLSLTMTTCYLILDNEKDEGIGDDHHVVPTNDTVWLNN